MKFLKYIFILFLFLLFILLIKNFVIKEGNINELLEQAQLYRTKADENYSQSQEYHALGDEAEGYAKSFLIQASDAEASANAQRELKINQEIQALRDEQIRIEAEEHQKQIMIEEENKRKQIETDRENAILAIQNRLLEAEMKDKTMLELTKELGNKLDALYTTILETQNKADELQKQSDMAKERDQENWNELSNDLKTEEMYLRITIEELINKYTNDNLILQESYTYAQNAHSEFLFIQKELADFTI